MSEPRRTPRLLSNLQIVFSAIIAISLLLAISFSGRISAGHKLEQELDKLHNVIATQRAYATALKGEYNYVLSDSFIEAWARREGKMVKGNEVLVIPVPGRSTPQPTPTPFRLNPVSAPTPQNDNWLLWWQLFFDTPPPR
jgi:cell division protein FtsB